jgi:hypothetical protein
MPLDSTHIVIRERGFAEIMDLALKVVRYHAGPLTLAGLVGVLPWAIVNGMLLNHLVSDLDIWDDSTSFLIVMTLVIAVQTPLATAPITLYLGQVTFLDQIDARRIVRDYFACLPQMLLHTLMRAVLAITFLGLMLPYGFWPYMSELILLERNPLFAGKAKRMTTRRRSRNLHRSSGGDLFGHWLAALGVGALLAMALVGGLHLAASQLAGYQVTHRQLIVYLTPGSIWAVVCFFAVVRFLSYLDLRIRREGWEVELKMRGEAAKLARGIV